MRSARLFVMQRWFDISRLLSIGIILNLYGFLLLKSNLAFVSFFVFDLFFSFLSRFCHQI